MHFFLPQAQSLINRGPKLTPEEDHYWDTFSRCVYMLPASVGLLWYVFLSFTATVVRPYAPGMREGKLRKYLVNKII